MNRAKKNILSVIITLLLTACIGFTVYQIKSQNTPPAAPTGQMQQQQPGSNSGSSSDSNSNDSNNSNANSNSKDNSSNSNTDSSSSSNDIIKGDKSNNNNNNNSSNNSNNNNQQTPPEKPSGSDSNSDSNSQQNNQPQPPSSNSSNGSSSSSSSSSSKNQNAPKAPSTKIATKYIVLLGAETFFWVLSILYLIFTGFHKKSFKKAFTSWKKFTICGLAAIVLTCGLTFGETYLVKQLSTPAQMQQPGNKSGNSNNSSGNGPSGAPSGSQPDNGSGSSNSDNDSASAKATATKTVSKNKKTLSGNYTSKKSDQSVLLVKNGGTLTLNNAVLNKLSGDSSNTENSEFYGINAGLLVTTKSTANVTNAKITTSAKGSNAVFATGTNAKINISDSTITTTGSGSARGLDATYGGTINADNVTVSTSGNSCASLATDRGEGTVTAKNSTLSTKGTGSPVIYSTGKISISNTTGTATGSQMVVIEGKNSATVTNSKLTASGQGNRNNVDNSGIMIYQSMSGDASTGTGTFTAKNSTLSVSKTSSCYKKAPMFFVTNTDAVINLTNTKLSYGSNTLLSVKGTSEWGQSGSNGGAVKLNASKQTLSGNISLDKLSTLTMNLKNSSTYTGTINAKNSAKKISLTLDSSSKIKLTGDSYVTSLSDADSSYSNIDFNGYKLYVNGKAINK